MKFLNKLKKKTIDIDDNSYDYFTKFNTKNTPETIKLIVVSYLPNQTAKIILSTCIKSIQKYTKEKHEIWIVDNNSPKENIEWLDKIKNVNIIFNRSKHIHNGSYDNAIALELATQIINPKTKYFMTLHMDTLVCKNNWLTYLLSKFNSKTKAVGVRIDKTRSKDGILHVLGYIVDFQLFKKLKLNFLPQLPNYDVGDLVTIKLKKAGFTVFACKNSLWQKELVLQIPSTSPLRNFNVDRTFDDKGNIFFMHLGRGVLKSINSKNFHNKVLPEEWVSFANKYIL